MKTINDYIEEFFLPRGLHLVQLKGKSPVKKDWPLLETTPMAARKIATKGGNLGWCPKDKYLIIDIDPRNGGDDSFGTLCSMAGTTPDKIMLVYPTIVTGSGGFHIYTERPTDFSPSKVSRAFPGVDLLHHNTQALIPGCIHPDTLNTYYPRPGSPWPIDPPMFPPGLQSVITEHWGSLGDFSDVDAPRMELRGVLNLDELEEILKYFDAQEFRAHDDWVSFILGIHHATDGDPGALPHLLEWCRSDPEYAGDPRVEGRLEQIWRAPTQHHKPRTVWWYINRLPPNVLSNVTVRARAEQREIDVILNEAQMLSGDVGSNHAVLTRLSRLSDAARQDAIQVLADYGLVANKKTIKSSIAFIATDDKQNRHLDIARSLFEKHFKNKLLFVRDRELYYFQDTHWTPITHTSVKYLVTNHLAAQFKSYSQMETIYKLIIQQAKLTFSLASTHTPSAFNLKNFTIHIDPYTAELSVRPHDPRDMFFHTTPFDYDPLAECPAFDKMLTQTFAHLPADELPQFISYFWEVLGYTIQPHKDIPLVLIWTGGGHNGKTTYTRFVSALAGGAVVGGEIRQFHKSEHARASLEHAMAFIDDDVAAGTILDDTFLKTCSESKEITINPKYQTPRRITIHATPILLTNNPITVLDFSRGMFRRVHVIPFHSDVSQYSQDLPRQALHSELPGIFNNALMGLARLRLRGQFDIPPCVRQATATFFRQHNPVLAYLDKHFTSAHAHAHTHTPYSLESVYQGYRAWSRSSGEYATLSRERFVDIMQRAGHHIQDDEIHNLALKPNATIMVN